MDLYSSPSASERFVVEVEKHFDDISGADPATLIAFQNLIFSFLIVIEKVGEDGDSVNEFIDADEEELTDQFGFTDDERIPIYDAGNDLMAAFREVLDEQRICPSLDDIDYIEHAISEIFSGSSEHNYFEMASETSELSKDIIDRVFAEAVAVEPVVAAPAPAPEPVAPEPKPILKKSLSHTRKVRHKSRKPELSTTRRVRFSHE
jgi:hypothetical protein